VNAFFATVNQMFGCSSQLSTTAERAVIKSLSAVQTKQCTTVDGSREVACLADIEGEGKGKKTVCEVREREGRFPPPNTPAAVLTLLLSFLQPAKQAS